MAEEEIPPHPDAVEGWPLPQEQAAWWGAPAVETLLAEAYAGGRMHHAWLLGGPKGVGKATLAYRFARHVLAYPDPRSAPPSLALDPEHRVFRQVAAGAHPNLLTLQRPWSREDKRYRIVVTVDEIRRIQHFFRHTAGEGRWRICVVDAADNLNAQAANALLKMLEEPPSDSLFLIVSHAPGRLLPTIRSRCRRLDLDPLPAAAIAEALAAGPTTAAATVEERRLAAELSGGSLRRAIQLIDNGGTALYRAFQEIAVRLPDVDMVRAHALADAVAARGADDSYAAFLDTVRDWLARRVRGLDEPEQPTGGGGLARVPLARWAQVWENVAAAAEEAAELNLDRKQVVLSIFMMLARAARM